ncbi:hypothetical protein [Nostoc sp.]
MKRFPSADFVTCASHHIHHGGNYQLTHPWLEVAIPTLRVALQS